MTPSQFLAAYRDEMAPTLGGAYMDGFIARNRENLLKIVEPVVALINIKAVIRGIDLSEEDRDYFLNEIRRFVDAGQLDRLAGLLTQARAQAQEPVSASIVEDPDAVTPAKDAIVWAAFNGLVNEKRRAFGMPELEVMESLPFFGRRTPDRRELIDFIIEIKETRKSDWRLAEVLAMHFEFPEAKIIDLLNELNVCPGATVRTMASKCDPSRYKAPEKSEGWLSRKFSGRPKRSDLLKVIRELKHERGSDWMLAPTLAGHFGVPDVTVVEWLRFHKICPRATVESMASQCVVEDVESLPAIGRTPIAITLRHPARRDLIAMVTASASEPGRFQLTWADNQGPSGHTTRDTPEEAVRHAVDEGYRLDSANTPEAQEMVERVERAREARAAEIESWLTESLPSRGRSVGRIGDRGWGSEVAADKLTARSREMASVRHNAQMTGDHAAWSRRVSAKVEALLAARKHYHSAPRSRDAVMMVESAEANLARELGGKEHIPLAIETYRWEQAQGQLSRGDEYVESLPQLVSMFEAERARRFHD